MIKMTETSHWKWEKEKSRVQRTELRLVIQSNYEEVDFLSSDNYRKRQNI